MFDAHAHIGDIITEDALICTSRPEEYEAVRQYRHRAYGLLPPFSSDSLEKLISAADADKEALIGEFGTDRRFNDPLEEKILYSLISLSKETDRPFILHQVGHTDRLLRALDSFQSLPAFMVHGFTGSAETARELIRRGGIISLGPRSERTRDFKALLALPFLLESDLPVGEREKKVIDHWYAAVAEYLETEPERLVETIDARRAVFTT